MDRSSLAVVIVAHDQPHHLRRLVSALAPLPIFLHVDANTPEPVFAEMTADLPERVHLLPRRPAGWACPEVAEAELDGYRAALTRTEADHFALLTGSDYPLTSVAELTERLRAHPGQTFGDFFALPSRNWLPLGGLERLLFPQRAIDRKRRVTGPPRPLPRGVRPGGGAQQKILARDHAARVLAALDADPALWPFFRSSWTPDEVAIPSLLRSPRRTGIDWPAEYGTACRWYTDWGTGRNSSPRWLGDADFDRIAAARADGAVFARKFLESNTGLLDRIESELW